MQNRINEHKYCVLHLHARCMKGKEDLNNVHDKKRGTLHIFVFTLQMYPQRTNVNIRLSLVGEMRSSAHPTHTIPSIDPILLFYPRHRPKENIRNRDRSCELMWRTLFNCLLQY